MANEKKLQRAKVQRLASCSYRIEHKEITPPEGVEREKRHGIIYETEGEATIIPFKKSDGSSRKAHKIRETEHGKLKLSAARQKVTVTVTLDRERDSEDAFLEEFHKLTEGYVLDLLKYEVEECLD